MANDQQLIIIEIDEYSIKELGPWPWPRGVHAKLVNQLSRHQTGPVVFDVIFSDVSAPPSQGDLEFAHAIRTHQQVVMPLYIESSFLQGPVIEIPPARLFYQELAGIGHIHVVPDSDGVVRGIFLKEGVGEAFWPHISYQALVVTGESTQLVGERAPETAEINPLVIARDYFSLVPMPREDQGFLRLSYVDVLSGQVDPDILKGKTIFVGSTAAGLGDFITTSAGTMAGVEFNGWLYQAIKHRGLIHSMTPNVLAIISAITVLFLVAVFTRLSPSEVLFTILAAMVFWLSLSAILLFQFNYWLPPFSVLFSLVIFYPLWSWLRLEVALRFLNNEIRNFRVNQQQISKNSLARMQESCDYLFSIGVLNDWQIVLAQSGRQTSARRDIVAASRSNIAGLHDRQLVIHHKDNDYEINVWIAHQEHDRFNVFASVLEGLVVERRRRLRSAELVGQTIEQLIAIRRQAELGQKLVEQGLSSLQDAVVISDLCGNILFNNQAFDRLVPITAMSSTLLERLKTITLEGELKWESVVLDASDKQEHFYLETSARNGEQNLLCQITPMLLSDYGVETIVYVFTDVTALKAVEKSRMEALNFLSHDLRSPMVSVLAILEQHQNQKIETNRATALIKQHVSKNLEYAESFLQLSRAENLIESKLHFTDLHSIIDAVQVHAQALAETNGLRLLLNRNIGECWIMADAALLERAVINLISNAVKYSPAGGLVSIDVFDRDGQVGITVIDEGCGISVQEQGKLFTRFHRIDNQQQKQGAGLGLYFVSVVMSRHGGTVQVESSEGIGSRFTVLLPIADIAIDDY